MVTANEKLWTLAGTPRRVPLQSHCRGAKWTPFPYNVDRKKWMKSKSFEDKENQSDGFAERTHNKTKPETSPLTEANHNRNRNIFRQAEKS